MSAKVNLTKRVSDGGKDRYCPVVFTVNGRIKSDCVVVDGVETRVPGGNYYLDWTSDGKRKRKSVGKNATQAIAQQLRKQTELKAIEQGLSVTNEEPEKRRRLDATIADYLDDIRASKKKKTWQSYSVSLGYFMKGCTKTYVEEIDRRDMLRFTGYLRDNDDMAPRTIFNKFAETMIFMKQAGVRDLIGKNDWPKYVEADVEIYEPEDLDKFFAVCDPEEKRWFRFFLLTGFREMEVVYCMGRNLNARHSTVGMTWKPEYKWEPKAYKEREVPIPAAFMTELMDLRLGRNELVFHTASGLPKLDFLDCCKAIAKRAGLDPADWYLHKFRATFATWHLQNAVDLRTVQQWLGHVDLASTLRYLRPARGVGVQEKVNSTFGAYL